ncbi:hypothetical protein INR49_030414 [Caranx melampygus]|nr:hypothetical protein INR49_030414 [Caranx melampygus]
MTNPFSFAPVCRCCVRAQKNRSPYEGNRLVGLSFGTTPRKRMSEDTGRCAVHSWRYFSGYSLLPATDQ